ncbi:MAG: CBS domain-containing protein [Candidatus Jordarchaeaceae archaeon]
MLTDDKEKFSIVNAMSREVVTCHVSDPLPKVAQLMVDNWISSVFVKDDSDKVVGIITDGIIFRLVAKEKDPRLYKAGDVMVKDIITVGTDASIDELRSLFDKTKVKRVGVVDSSGKIIGVISKRWVNRFKRYTRYYEIELQPKESTEKPFKKTDELKE